MKTLSDTKLITENEKYKPVYISPITSDQFRFFDESIESQENEKQTVCNIIEKIRYCYFVDKYNIQWEFEEGHNDVGE